MSVESGHTSKTEEKKGADKKVEARPLTVAEWKKERIAALEALKLSTLDSATLGLLRKYDPRLKDMKHKGFWNHVLRILDNFAAVGVTHIGLGQAALDESVVAKVHGFLTGASPAAQPKTAH